MRRDSHTCRYCGATAPDVKLTIDHVTPTTLGGGDEPSNLVTACADCNAGKSATPPDASLVADVDAKALEWGQAMTTAMAQRMAAFSGERARTDRFDKVWVGWTDAPREGNWRNSITRFLALGLTEEFLASAVDSAMGNRQVRLNGVWKYFCGICWSEIRKAQADIAPGAAPAANRPKAQSLTYPFDFMDTFDGFVDRLVHALGGDERLGRYIHRELWEAIPFAHAAWDARLDEGDPPDDENYDTVEDAAIDAARIALHQYLIEPIQTISTWHDTVYGPRKIANYADGVTDGEE